MITLAGKGNAVLVIALFVFIAWIAVSIFTLIPKYLSMVENIIVFLGLNMLNLNLFSFTDSLPKLIQHSKNPEMWLSLCIHRNIILPLCLLTYVNYINFVRARFNKIVITGLFLVFLSWVEYLTVWTGVRVYTGWNEYLAMVTLMVFMMLSVLLTRLVRKIK